MEIWTKNECKIDGWTSGWIDGCINDWIQWRHDTHVEKTKKVKKMSWKKRTKKIVSKDGAQIEDDEEEDDENDQPQVT